MAERKKKTGKSAQVNDPVAKKNLDVIANESSKNKNIKSDSQIQKSIYEDTYGEYSKELKSNHFASHEFNEVFNNMLLSITSLNSRWKDSISRLDIKSLNSNLNKINNNFKNTLNKEPDITIIEKLTSSYKSEKLVFVLGAGISAEYGLPSWDMLLQKMMVKSLDKTTNHATEISKFFNKIFNPSPLIAGRYLQKHFDNQSILFEEEIRGVLYEESNTEHTTPLMHELIKFCVAPGKSPNINSIITYNFDDILEQKIKEKELDIPFKSIFGNEIENETEKLAIYHVHGYLPQNGKLTSMNKITLGENMYHEQYNDTYSWNNIVQINKFRENNCLFIGTSLTDPNTRRLLDISRKQRTNSNNPHYIFKKKYDKLEVAASIKLLASSNPDMVESPLEDDELENIASTLVTTVHNFEENDLLTFGIRTIWVDSYENIPTILSKIRTTN